MEEESNPPQETAENRKNKNDIENDSKSIDRSFLGKGGLMSYIKHWLQFHFFLKNRTMEESVSDVITEISTFGNRAIKKEEKKMITDLLDFYDLTVDEIKIPRNEILAINENDLTKVFDLIKHKKVSRIPVFKDNLDNIIGFLSVKDLLVHFYENKNLDNTSLLIQEMLFIPPSMKASDLLLKMKKTRIHIATIVDEYGGTDGIITINSIISEIVGTINEEGNGEELVKDIGNGELEVNGRAELDDLKENYNVDLNSEENDEIETINGLIFCLRNEVPEIGEIIDLPNSYKAEILEVTDRMVLKLIIRR